MKSLHTSLATLLVAFATSAAAAPGDGAVFVLSNAADSNEVAVLKRAPSGQLVKVRSYSTGGIGSGVGEALGSDPLGTQNGMVLSADKRWLFAVNAGSDQVSAFRVIDGDRLKLVGVLPSGGDYPASIAVHRDLVYVINTGGDATVSGFRIGHGGKFEPIPNSTLDLGIFTPYVVSQPDSFNSPSQIQFTPDGQWLIVVDKDFTTNHGTIRLYPVQEDGRLGATPVITESPDPAPFGFIIDRRGRMLITEGISSAVSSYDINDDGTLTPISLSVSNGQIAACWIGGTSRFVYSTNTLSDNISGYRVAQDGSLTLLDADGITATSGAGPVDVVTSGDGRYLSVVNSGSGTVGTYRINPATGALTLVGETQVFGALTGMEGMVSTE